MTLVQFYNDVAEVVKDVKDGYVSADTAQKKLSKLEAKAVESGLEVKLGFTADDLTKLSNSGYESSEVESEYSSY
jgi:hypothetical protein